MGEDKKRQKRKEAYKKAVEHKMKSAANLVESYHQIYELTSEETDRINIKSRLAVKRKLLIIVGRVFLQTLVLVCIVLLAFLPFRNNFNKVIENYFNAESSDFSKIELIEDFVGSENESENVYYDNIENPKQGTFYAKLNVHDFSSKIYYGISEKALLEGVCQYSQSSLPGFGEPIMLYGYSSTHFSFLQSVKTGDVLSITTNYGVYKYKAVETKTFSSESEAPYDLQAETEQLILCTDYPFGEYKTETGKTFCVVLDKVSGPAIQY